MEKSKKDILFASSATVLVHVGIALFLIYSMIKFENPEEQSLERGGVLVQIGFMPNASGTAEVIEPQPIPQEVPHTTPQPAEEILTQEEPSVNLQEASLKEEEERKRKEEEERKLREAQEQAAQTDQMVSSAFSKFANKGENESGKGAEGSVQGNTTDGASASSGIGGYGNISLGGRGIIGKLPKPSYDRSNDEGTIVVNIRVNTNGTVTDARATVTGSKGTAYHNPNLRAAAENAARSTKFESSSDPNQQQGTITYYFKTN